MGVLTVQVHGARAQLGQRIRRRQSTVDVGPRPAVGWDDAGYDVFLLADNEPAVDACLDRSGSHEGRISTSADQQVDRFDQHRLARACLSGEGGQPRRQHEVQAFDDAHRFDMKLVQHVSGRTGRTSS